MKGPLAALLAGLLFALGLGISGMTQPAKVLAFLDVTGAWDPSLALVMVGAIAAHAPFVRRARFGRAPLFAATFELPPSRPIDARLVIGAAVFGVGWGVVGYCPGPAIVAAGSLSPAAWLFVGAMVAGMALARAATRSLTPRTRALPPESEGAL